MSFFRTPVKSVALKQSTVVFIMICMQKLKECKKSLSSSFVSKISGLSSITFYTDTQSGEFNCGSSES